jgi:hypothetical protein
MARTNNRGGNSSSNRSRNNNPSGRNQYSGGVLDLARDRPVAAAAVAAGAAAAGLFLWTKRSQISEQISGLSDQIGEWTESMRSGEQAGDEPFIASGKSGKSQSEISEEALTLKSTGKKTKRPTDETVDLQTKAGTVAY